MTMLMNPFFFIHLVLTFLEFVLKRSTLLYHINKNVQLRMEITRRDMPVQVVMSEHMSVHAPPLMMRSVKLNPESIDMIKLFLIWQAHSSPNGRYLPVSAGPLNLFCRAALIEIWKVLFQCRCWDKSSEWDLNFKELLNNWALLFTTKYSMCACLLAYVILLFSDWIFNLWLMNWTARVCYCLPHLRDNFFFLI